MFQNKCPRKQRKKYKSPFTIYFIYYLINILTKIKNQYNKNHYRNKNKTIIKIKYNNYVFFKKWTPTTDFKEVVLYK